ncbi:MAG: universal stress protein [Cocleimonas sp.]
MYNTIIVPTDFSDEESTIQSLQKAEKLSDNGRIILLHVLENIPAHALALADIPTEVMQELVPKTRDALKELVSMSKVKAVIEVRNGNSYRQIINSVEEHEADLIIINSHRPGLKDYLLGSTAAKVVRHSPSNVLVVR